MGKSSYKHWRNSQNPGETAFITTTCLNFATLFERTEMRDELLHRICEDCIRYQAILHAYVIMPHHFHAIITAPKEKSLSWLMQRIKTNTAKYFLPKLLPHESSQLDSQTGLDGRSFWMRSFRSFPINNDKLFREKVEYIHMNPVRANLVLHPRKYRWSSYENFERGFYCPEIGHARIVMGTLQTSSLEG